ncbi:MAG: hypothetical protein M3511_11260, partial [Deinococcota bacterium]|nr:hypothetical protein [Deinococcota bacterium]
VVVQADYARKIFPHTTNSLRIITMQDPENDHRPFIAVASHRFGVLETIPVDNFTRGGLRAKIDLDTGKMTSAKKHPARTKQEFTRHPETDAQIEGVEVPHWQEVKEGLLQMVAALPFVKFVGWDVVVTEEGFCILEGNNPPSLGIQGWYPFFQDPRIRRFFEYYKVIK